ncbi:MAG TPA: dephospho-CoA kinase [Steroidobacteraceae bacterium]|nr:dephospho-CoA kinase [Steroidobacteraceae bacterium]
MASGTPMRVALTGGIASGKSAVATLFADLGVPVIDLDEIAREVVIPGSALLAQVIERFGAGVRATDGSLDRRALRELVFRDAGARTALESLLHPAIRARAAEREAAVRGPYSITVIPLLAETERASDYDRVLLVDCDERVQRERLARRDGSSAATIEAILGAQASRETRRALAHDVIVNNGALAALAPQVQALHAKYQQLSRGGVT